jgi:hypothetical protein
VAVVVAPDGLEPDALGFDALSVTAGFKAEGRTVPVDAEARVEEERVSGGGRMAGPWDRPGP